MRNSVPDPWIEDPEHYDLELGPCMFHPKDLDLGLLGSHIEIYI